MLAKIINDVVEKYPYSIGQLRKDYSNVSFPKNPNPEMLAAFNVFDVVSVDRPEVDHTQDVNEGVPQKINGVWTQVWNVSDVDEETLAGRTEDQANNVRAERDQKLNATDWTQVADSPVDSTAWAVYRQSLRDVPTQADFPWKIIWPEQPE